MPVIGRLDGQVDELIIAPISRRRGDAEENAEQPREQVAPAAPASETPNADESSDKTDELPVWLL